MRLTDHSSIGDALWFEVGEELGRFSINEFCLITGMKCVGSIHLPVVESRLITRYFSTLRGVSREHLEIQLSNANFDNDDDAIKLSLLYLIFFIPLSNANSATHTAICNTVENRLSSKRRPLKKTNKVHYSIAGFPHALLVWAYETLPSIALKFSTKYNHAIPRMLSWTTTDNVKFDDVMSAFTQVGENQPKSFVMMPTEEELKDPWVARLYLKNPSVVPNLPPKTPAPPPSSDTNSEWREFQKEIRGEVVSIKKKLASLKKGQGEEHTAFHVSSSPKTNVHTPDSDALKTTPPHIAAIEFFTADKVIVSREDVKDEKNKEKITDGLEESEGEVKEKSDPSVRIKEKIMPDPENFSKVEKDDKEKKKKRAGCQTA
ncbi:hypothetical protein TIFTF001_024828 [Ficus carica]|uniref:DUF1985 domain-containing protein n=1 Tax=Ficus carica TaxID=3494 RepID=A0AA88AIN6_FICCA|nr:hypothetical protein TIFTF001_024828 [Ficus carica]